MTDRVEVTVNGFPLTATVDRPLVDGVLLPALREVAGRTPPDVRRRFVFLAAPPGVGKSTLAAILAHEADDLDLQVVGLDGFHFPNTYLDSRAIDTATGPVPLRSIKGAPETFDLAGIDRHLTEGADRDLAWPTYDRNAHDVVPGPPVTAELVLVEGNWLLLDEPGWRELARHSVLNIFVDAAPELLRDRLIERKVRGGSTPAEAATFYDHSDRPNIERAVGNVNRAAVDIALHMTPDGTIERGESR